MIFCQKFDCIYSAEGEGGTGPDDLFVSFSVDLGHYACFADIYSKIEDVSYSEITYRVYLFKENLPNKNFNLCTKAETKKILRCLQKVVNFTYKFSSDRFTVSGYTTTETDFWVLEVTIKGSYSQHLWVTSMLRCFFEWPFNVAAKEACEMQSIIKEADGIDFANANWLNIYLTIVSLLGSYGLHGIVDFGVQPKLRTYQEWQKKLSGMKGNCSVIDKLRKKGSRYSKEIKNFYIDSQHLYDQGIKSRASKYVAAYKDKLSWKR